MSNILLCLRLATIWSADPFIFQLLKNKCAVSRFCSRQSNTVGEQLQGLPKTFFEIIFVSIRNASDWICNWIYFRTFCTNGFAENFFHLIFWWKIRWIYIIRAVFHFRNVEKSAKSFGLSDISIGEANNNYKREQNCVRPNAFSRHFL